LDLFKRAALSGRRLLLSVPVDKSPNARKIGFSCIRPSLAGQEMQ
jgi:hypothetical protein